MVLIVLLIGIPIMLATIFCVYIFYKGIKEKNKIKIIIPLILFVIVRRQIKYIIGCILNGTIFFGNTIFPIYNRDNTICYNNMLIKENNGRKKSRI